MKYLNHAFWAMLLLLSGIAPPMISAQNSTSFCFNPFVVCANAQDSSSAQLSEYSIHFESTNMPITIERHYHNVPGLFCLPWDSLAPIPNFRVSITKSDDLKNGIDINDMLEIQRHILGIKRITDTARIIAADVNSSNDVTALDIVTIRKILLGFYDGYFPYGPSYRVFHYDPNKPQLWESHATVSQLTFTGTNYFRAVKRGDVDCSAHPRGGFMDSIDLVTQERWVEAGQEFEFTLSTTQPLSAIQMAITFTDLEFISAKPDAETSFGFVPSENALRIVGLTLEPAIVSQFSIQVRAKSTRSGYLSSMLIPGNGGALPDLAVYCVPPTPEITYNVRLVFEPEVVSKTLSNGCIYALPVCGGIMDTTDAASRALTDLVYHVGYFDLADSTTVLGTAAGADPCLLNFAPKTNRFVLYAEHSLRADSLLGVDVADGIDIMMHTLGRKRIDHLDQERAADINASGDITAIDLVALRKIILGLGVSPQFGRKSWVFSIGDHTGESPIKPGSPYYPSDILDSTAYDRPIFLRAVKQGDINCLNAPTNPQEPLTLMMEEKNVLVGEELSLRLTADQIYIGLQTAFSLDGLEYLGLDGSVPLGFDASFSAPRGELRLFHLGLLDNSTPLEATLRFRALKTGFTSNMITFADIPYYNQIAAVSLSPTDYSTHPLELGFVTYSSISEGNLATKLRISPSIIGQNDRIFLEIDQNGLSFEGESRVSMTCADGRVVCDASLPFHAGKAVLDLSKSTPVLHSGLYWLTVVDTKTGQRAVGKVVMQR